MKMRFMLKIILYLAISVFSLQANISVKENEIILENNQVKKIIACFRHQTGPIRIKSILMKTVKKELIREDRKTPYFAFVINGQRVASSDSCWLYRRHIIRKMMNGGEELACLFEGQKIPVNGLPTRSVRRWTFEILSAT